MPEPGELEKVDMGLLMAMRAYEEQAEATDDDAGISVSLRFEGDLTPIEALGFETHSVSEDQALGVVRFRDVARIAAHPGVLWIAAGSERRPTLETAVPDARVRASTAGSIGSGGDGLWHAVTGTGALTATADATGKNVIVAVIDTGIDFTHPMFMSQLTPAKKTRIKRIWDQGVSPASLAQCPPVARLVSLNTYGVEYDDAEIDAALNGGPAVNHKDCDGHGTHVAGIAAGGVLFPAGGDARRVGVAPEADIIAVKLLDVPDRIRFRSAAGFGADVGHDARFRDAVMYCLRTAQALGKPVVINMSIGNSAEAGDGLDDDARWVDARMNPAQPAGPMNFPRGAIVVKSAGNDGDVARRQVARITVPAAGQITVPFELVDTRGPLQTKFKNCAHTPHKPPLGVDFWYRRDFDRVKFALRLPRQAGFSGDMGIGGFLDRGFVPRVGPPPSVAMVSVAPGVHKAFVRHETNPSVPHPDGGNVRRHKLAFWLEPKVSGGTISYHQGIYEVRIRAPAGTEVFAMCDRASWAPGKFVAMQVAATMQDGSALAPGIDVTSEFSCADPLGRHVITVAAYNDTDGNAAHADHHKIASFSSRGPLRDFSDPPGSRPPIATKPDLAAPGVKIDSAQGVDTDVPFGVRTPSWLGGRRFIEKGGTSMSAPVVAGLVALMLDKKNDLSVTEVRAALAAASAARPGVNPAPPGDAHTRAYGAGMVDGLAAHLATP